MISPNGNWLPLPSLAKSLDSHGLFLLLRIVAKLAWLDIRITLIDINNHNVLLRDRL